MRTSTRKNLELKQYKMRTFFRTRLEGGGALRTALFPSSNHHQLPCPLAAARSEYYIIRPCGPV